MEEDTTELLQQLSRLQLAEKSAVQINQSEPDYVLGFDVQKRESDPLVAAVCSNFSIRLMLRERLTTKSILSGHEDTVTGVSFGKSNENLVFSCSKDKSVRCWDVRTNKETHSLKDPPNISGEYLSLDVGNSDNLLCAGTEKIGDDAYLLFWDLRKCSVLGCYNECHDDDINQVHFQPGSDKYLASGSGDGLVCTFDLSETSEDDALLTTSNAMADVEQIGWCGEDNSCVYCITCCNMFYVWDAMEGEEFISLNIEDIENVHKKKSPVDYLVGCIPELTNKSSAVIIGGTQSGDLQWISHSSDGSEVFSILSGGHSAMIRCAQWDNKSKTLLTGGEDSLLCLWSGQMHNSSTARTKDKTSGKIKSKASITDSSRKPYNKERKKK